MREINKIAEGLFEKIRDRFEEVSLGDENAKATQTPEDARFFNFDYTVDGHNHGNITMSLIDETSLKIYFSKNISDDLDEDHKKDWYTFLRELREFARRNLLSFEPRDITRSTLKHRDIQQQSKADSTYNADDVVSEGKMYGTKNRSYESFGPVRIKLQHSKPIVDEVHGSRSRNIDSVFIENAEGERFKLPFNNLTGARAMARHVSAGGIPTDELGQHITEMVGEMMTLRPFVRGMSRRTFENTVTLEMVESAFGYHGLLKNTLKKMKGKRGYTEFKENYTPALVEDEADISDLKELFVKKSLDERIEQALPLVHKAHTIMRENNNPFAQQFESWAQRVSEGTWAIPETEENIAKLNELLKKPLPAGVDGANATGALGDLIGDDVLWDNIGDLGDIDPEADTRGLIVQWVDDNMPEIMDQLKGKSGFVQMDEATDDDYSVHVGAKDGLEIFKNNEPQYCMNCHNLSHMYAEIADPENPTDGLPEGEAEVVCPNCKSPSYFIATEKEIETYGPPKDNIELDEATDDDYDAQADQDAMDYEADINLGDNDDQADAVYDAILRRFQGNLDLVIKVGGPRETMAAIQDYVDSEDWSDLQEIGSSDVSAWVDNIVKQHSTPDNLERLKRLSGMEVKEGRMKELHYDLENASDEEFEKNWKSKKSDWQEVKTPGLAKDPNKPAYIGKMKMHEEKPVYEAHEKLEKLVGQRVYVKNKGQTGTVDQVSTTHSNALVVDMDNGQTTVSHFTDLTSEDEKPSTLTRYLDMLKDVLDLHGRGAVHKKGLPAKSYDAMEESTNETEYQLWWNGEEIDSFASKEEAVAMQKEYEMAYKGGVSIKKAKVKVEEASDTHCSDKCCGSDVKAEDCGCPPDCPHCNCNAKLDEAEKYTQDDINAAIKIANSSTGNMTDATDRIETIEDGLSNHPDVEEALKKANESREEMISLKRLSGIT